MLDKNRPFGVVIGMAGVSYEQDGKLFDTSGKSIDEIVEKIEPTRMATGSHAVIIDAPKKRGRPAKNGLEN